MHLPTGFVSSAVTVSRAKARSYREALMLVSHFVYVDAAVLAARALFLPSVAFF